MNYIIENGDTVFVADIPPSFVSPKDKMSKREWREYYLRVHNFSKAYPYAVFISEVIKQTDSTFIARNYNKRMQDKYLDRMKQTLLSQCEPLFRNLTLKQGLMMIRLIDREVGMTPYYIIKDYLGGTNAGFWQGIAKMFKGDLKQPYDKFGEDKDLEELVKSWESGDFDYLYFAIFGKDKPEMRMPDVTVYMNKKEARAAAKEIKRRMKAEKRERRAQNIKK